MILDMSDLARVFRTQSTGGHSWHESIQLRHLILPVMLAMFVQWQQYWWKSLPQDCSNKMFPSPTINAKYSKT